VLHAWIDSCILPALSTLLTWLKRCVTQPEHQYHSSSVCCITLIVCNVSCYCCRCGEAFLAAGHHDKAVRLLVRAHQPQRALDLLVEHQVPLTEELAEALTPEKTPDNTDSRAAILMRIAQVTAWHRALMT